MTWIKICGLTSLRDAAAALDAGADALGFVLAQSPRRMSPAEVLRIRKKLPAHALVIAVLVDATAREARALLEAGVADRLQLHGRVPPGLPCSYPSVSELPWTADDTPRQRLPPLLLFDAARAGGTGWKADWDAARRLARRTRVILAGGLEAGNVAEAVRRVRPFGVDASSGVESRPGVKDLGKVRRFCDAVRRAT